MTTPEQDRYLEFFGGTLSCLDYEADLLESRPEGCEHRIAVQVMSR
jgi:hypothetical protein